MNKLTAWIGTFSLSLLLFACAGEKQAEKADMPEEPMQAAITLTPLEGSPAFAEASLSLNDVPSMADDSSYAFSFNVSGYTLGEQTTPANTNNLANSGKGQHIHFIVNNGPYSAHYEPNFTSNKFKENGNYVVLAFLSRSYHESVKNLADPSSVVVTQINKGGVGNAADLSAPHMFYSRPKGTYSGEGAKKVLLDFFLLNTELAADGNKVRATINGDAVFMIDKWQPYVIEGAPMGTLTVKLEFLDAAGNMIPSPFNPVMREVKLEE
ncbi:MAG: phosphopeptide-binding protein [Bacteroidia bacterium]